MVEVMPFGKYSGYSIEQIAFRDYRYFSNFLVDDLLKNKKIKKFSLERRIEFVEYKINNFKSIQPCGKSECKNNPRLISIYRGYNGEKTSSSPFVYCSRECFENDPRVTIQKNKISLEPLKFRSALSEKKGDTNEIIDVMAHCIGIKKSRLTKEYLEDFINNLPTYFKLNHIFTN